MFRGFATLNFYADDIAAARDWYTEVFEQEAYYAFPPAPAPPAYVEFRVGDDADEFGLIDRRFAPEDEPGRPGGALMHWHVDDLPGTLDRLIELGATLHRPIVAHGDGEGFATASVIDPFGNVLGIMHNPHFIELHAGGAEAAA